MTRASDTARALSGGATFNEAGADVDFRVESDTVDHALFVDGATGNVSIGTSSPTSKLSILSATNTGITVNDGTVNTILFNTSSANGSLGTTTNHPFVFYTNNAEKIRIHTNGVVSASAGVALGVGTANTASNVLDDYEEGEYDIVATMVSGSITFNSSVNRASYTKVGRLVHVQGFATVSSVSSPSGWLSLSLPFTVASLTENSGKSTANLYIYGVNSANVSDFVSTVNEGGTVILIQMGDTVSPQNDAANEIKAASGISFSVSYHTA